MLNILPATKMWLIAGRGDIATIFPSISSSQISSWYARFVFMESVLSFVSARMGGILSWLFPKWEQPFSVSQILLKYNCAKIELFAIFQRIIGYPANCSRSFPVIEYSPERRGLQWTAWNAKSLELSKTSMIFACSKKLKCTYCALYAQWNDYCKRLSTILRRRAFSLSSSFQ